MRNYTDKELKSLRNILNERSIRGKSEKNYLEHFPELKKYSKIIDGLCIYEQQMYGRTDPNLVTSSEINLCLQMINKLEEMNIIEIVDDNLLSLINDSIRNSVEDKIALLKVLLFPQYVYEHNHDQYYSMFSEIFVNDNNFVFNMWLNDDMLSNSILINLYNIKRVLEDIDKEFKIKNEDEIAMMKCIAAFFYAHIEEYNYDYNRLKAMCYFYLENKNIFKENVKTSNKEEIKDISDKDSAMTNCYAKRKIMQK